MYERRANLKKMQKLHCIKISLNTLDRHLKLFVQCDLVFTIKNDTARNFKLQKRIRSSFF
ncbi:MAG TPA: hypothetical protein CFH84_08235 [Sulfurimonas sp. UBA12504]|nr:MAG TPA: hypothetical protein CFH84_08235 [Sulfurimonas sp. UBA12504]